MDRSSVYASHCRVCGAKARLAFGVDDWLGAGATATAPSLCEGCFETADHWYAPEFERWCHAANRIIDLGPGNPDAIPHPTWSSGEFFNVRPARFLKHVTTMLLAIAPPGFAIDEHRDLAAYAAGPKRRGLPARYQFYLTLFRGPNTRTVGYSAQLNPATRRTEELIELACPPFSCVLSLSGEAAIETTNISDFAELGMDETCIVDLDLLEGFAHTPYPADFRSSAALAQERVAERRVA